LYYPPWCRTKVLRVDHPITESKPLRASRFENPRQSARPTRLLTCAMVSDTYPAPFLSPVSFPIIDRTIVPRLSLDGSANRYVEGIQSALDLPQEQSCRACPILVPHEQAPLCVEHRMPWSSQDQPNDAADHQAPMFLTFPTISGRGGESHNRFSGRSPHHG
jgi:hypothetical protein